MNRKSPLLPVHHMYTGYNREEITMVEAEPPVASEGGGGVCFHTKNSSVAIGKLRGLFNG